MAYYRNHKNIKKGIIVEVCEGEGDINFPIELVKYVYDEKLNLIGIIETDLSKKNFK